MQSTKKSTEWIRIFSIEKISEALLNGKPTKGFSLALRNGQAKAESQFSFCDFMFTLEERKQKVADKNTRVF